MKLCGQKVFAKLHKSETNARNTRRLILTNVKRTNAQVIYYIILYYIILYSIILYYIILYYIILYYIILYYIILYYIILYILYYILQGVPGGTDLTSGECSLGQTVPI